MSLKDKKGLWIGLAAAVVVIAVACVLVFVVFQDQIFEGSSGPELTVQDLLTAMENQDLDALFALMDPQGIEELEAKGLMTEEDLKQVIGGGLTGYESIEFANVKMETEISEDGENAVVTIVRGTVTVVVDGETSLEDVEDSDEPQQYYLVKRDGKWYMDIMSIAE
jgi:hypothetical protein